MLWGFDNIMHRKHLAHPLICSVKKTRTNWVEHSLTWNQMQCLSVQQKTLAKIFITLISACCFIVYKVHYIVWNELIKIEVLMPILPELLCLWSSAWLNLSELHFQVSEWEGHNLLQRTGVMINCDKGRSISGKVTSTRSPLLSQSSLRHKQG